MKLEQRAPQLRLKLEGWRSRLVLIIVTAAFALLAARALNLQALQTGFLQAKGEARYGRVLELPASQVRRTSRSTRRRSARSGTRSAFPRRRFARKLPEKIASSPGSSARFRPTRRPR